MRREFKFRVFYPHEKLMLYSKNIEEHYSSDQNLNIGSSLFPLTIRSTSANYMDYIIQQYTGLKDKNGEEIYEGDIIKNGDGLLMCVKWNLKHAAFRCSSRNLDGWMPMLQELIDEFEIVGNIYENPELLKNDSN